MLPALVNIIRMQLESRPSEGPSFEATMVRRCFQPLCYSCCWVDGIQHLQLAHPLMERCATNFAKIGPTAAGMPYTDDTCGVDFCLSLLCALARGIRSPNSLQAVA